MERKKGDNLGNFSCCRSSEFMLWHSITTSDSLHQWLNTRKWLKYWGSELLSQPSVLCCIVIVVNHSIDWVTHYFYSSILFIHSLDFWTLLWPLILLALTPSIQDSIMSSGQGVVSTIGWCCDYVGLLIYCQYIVLYWVLTDCLLLKWHEIHESMEDLLLLYI